MKVIRHQAIRPDCDDRPPALHIKYISDTSALKYVADVGFVGVIANIKEGYKPFSIFFVHEGSPLFSPTVIQVIKLTD